MFLRAVKARAPTSDMVSANAFSLAATVKNSAQ